MIKATIHSDDHLFEHEFDATPWFQTATRIELAELDLEAWGRCQVADHIAYEVEDTNEDVKYLLEYCRRKTTQGPGAIGFEVHVDEESALAWLAVNRPIEHHFLTAPQVREL